MNIRDIQPIPILTFHKIDPHFEWGVTRITPRQFRSALQFLKERNYQSVSLAQLCNGKHKLPEKSIVLTFDDAYDSLYSYALPILLDFQFTGTVFVISDYVNRWNAWDINLGRKKFKHMSWKQLIDLKNLGFEIGSHGMTHVDFTRIDNKLLLRELSKSKSSIEQHIGHPVDFVSFPFGRYNDRVIECSQKCGYIKGCGYFHRKKKKKNYQESFVLERKAYYLFDTRWNLNAKIGQSFWTSIENMKLRLVSFGSYGTLLLKKAE